MTNNMFMKYDDSVPDFQGVLTRNRYGTGIQTNLFSPEASWAPKR